MKVPIPNFGQRRPVGVIYCAALRGVTTTVVDSWRFNRHVAANRARRARTDATGLPITRGRRDGACG
jgi:hypothetical protein